jgi:diguanylate cyclase (GGDEF)-like protein
MDFKRHPESGVNSIYGHFADITERKLAVRQLEHLTIHDSLTGLYNRRYFEISLEHVIAGSARSELPHALLYIDLDHFQMVNSCFSHRDGDLALKEISALLASRTREADLLCRMGGDEFAMLLTNTDSQRAMAVAEGLVDLLNGYQYSRDGHRITIGCSIGVSMIDGDRSSSCEYLIRADKASFVAKSRGRNLVHIYNPEDREDDELRQGIDWAHRVRQALGDNRLDLYIQPVREVATGNINYYEALLRLRSQDLTTIIAPGVFIPAMEKAGQIHLLDRWVINRAVESLSQYAELERLAVNLSGRAFADPQLPALVEDLLLKHGVDPKRIIFEITETTSIANINQTQHMIHRLRGLGCHFALDDFGTGYCSFHYLRQLPVDYIKLDGSYIKNIVSNEFDRAMVRSMNEIAHLLGKKTVAECVETDEVLSYLKDIGVDYVQGYSIGNVHPLETLCR